MGGGWLGDWAGGWSGRSHINDHCARINSVQCIPVERWLGSVLSNRMTRQVDDNPPLTNPVWYGFRNQSTLIYLFFLSNRWRAPRSQPGSKML